MKYEYPTTHMVVNILNNGRRISIRCPTGQHRDRIASMVLYPDGSFHCYGCGVHGRNGLDFLINVFGNSVQESMQYLNDKGLLKKINT